MLTLQPEIFQAMIFGDRKPYVVGLLVPDPEWAKEFARSQGLPEDPALLREHAPFTIENKQLTPSLRIRRHVLREVCGDRLNALYKG